jgi:CMP-N,N'-diacetyllegionaminic acid synthase
MRVLGIVTARGGSKGVPRKNVRELAGKPLIAWTAEAARAATRLSRVVLSTDDEEIAEVGRRAGLDVPFMRPAELALDSTPSLPVLQHVVRTLEASGERYDATCLLQPTSPLREPATIDRCIELLESSGADSVVTVLPVPAEYNPHWVFFQDPAGALVPAMPGPLIPRRQDLPAAFHREGQVYVTRRDVLIEQSSLYGAKTVGYAIDPRASVNIDTPEDWARAEAMLAGRR